MSHLVLDKCLTCYPVSHLVYPVSHLGLPSVSPGSSQVSHLVLDSVSPGPTQHLTWSPSVCQSHLICLVLVSPGPIPCLT